jgi:thiamine transport system ATP-binding protein
MGIAGVISLEKLRFIYEDLVMEFDLEVDAGEFLAVIGPSGAGKSTLLALIAGFENPVSGRIQLSGRDMTGVPPADRPVSMVFQDHNTFAHLDLWTNVALGISPRLHLSMAERERVDIALARTGLTKLAHRKPGEISGGERQRVAISRALVRDKPVLLLDEPFAALGPALRREMLDLLLKLQAERGFTIVLVSHHPQDARYAARRTAFLNNGHIDAIGPTREILERGDIAALSAYLGDWEN